MISAGEKKLEPGFLLRDTTSICYKCGIVARMLNLDVGVSAIKTNSSSRKWAWHNLSQTVTVKPKIDTVYNFNLSYCSLVKPVSMQVQYIASLCHVLGQR